MVLLGMANKVAAMPSLHTGIAALVAFWAISRLRSPWRWLLLLYPVAMGLALCYFGEHYVIDEIAGVALAAAGDAGLVRSVVGHAHDVGHRQRLAAQPDPLGEVLVVEDVVVHAS